MPKRRSSLPSVTSPVTMLLVLAAAAAGLAFASRSVDAAECARTVRAARRGAAAAVGLRPVCTPLELRLDRSPVASPSIEGPVTGGRGMPTLSATSFDLADVGYVREEYFLGGTATAYTSSSSLGSNGRWPVAPAITTEYKTRIVVFRPADPATASGTVLVEWLNVSGGLDAAPDWITIHTELIRTGATWVGVSAQFVGVEGGASPLAPTLGGLKVADPERYATLSHPGDSYSFDMFSQAGKALLAPNGPDPLGGIRIERLIAAGESQSAFRLVTYVNAIDPVARIYDGFLIHSRGGGGAPLSQDTLPQIRVPDVARIRSDVRVPVLTFQTETDVIGLDSYPDRQPDSRNFRLWEAAGTAHADTYTLLAGFTDVGGEPSVAAVVVTDAPIPGIIECDSAINSGPQHWIAKAALRALERWVGGGSPPSRAPRLRVAAGDPPRFLLDEHGNVRGGIRTSYVDAPTAVLSGLGQSGSSFCGIFGTTVPLDDATLAGLYPTNADYVAAVRRSNDRAVGRGFLLREDADLIEAWAAESGIGG